MAPRGPAVKRGRDEAPEKDGGEPFLSRWSRRKQEAREAPPPGEPAPDPRSPAPELPPVEKLTIDSDYRAFFHPRVDEDVRRSALKKLFTDPRFNVMDGLDVYIDDYSKTEPIPPEMLAGLKQAQNILRWAREDREEREREEAQRLAARERGSEMLEPPATAPAETPAAAPAAVPSASSGNA
ncbi:MAG: DUF3306 domain-containing protein [Burkholderiales bacterium]|nr:DUF3306 domain-containing protein [Burkholderiales bacterium]